MKLYLLFSLTNTRLDPHPTALGLFNSPVVGSAPLAWFLGSDKCLAVVKEKPIIGTVMSSF